MPAFPKGMHVGHVVPLDRANVDTDAIFPKQYGRSTASNGFGRVLFDLAHRQRIEAFEAAHLMRQPWLDRRLEH